MIAIATIPASTPIARLLVPTVAATVTSITSVSGHGLRASSPANAVPAKGLHRHDHHHPGQDRHRDLRHHLAERCHQQEQHQTGDRRRETAAGFAHFHVNDGLADHRAARDTAITAGEDVGDTQPGALPRFIRRRMGQVIHQLSRQQRLHQADKGDAEGARPDNLQRGKIEGNGQGGESRQAAAHRAFIADGRQQLAGGDGIESERDDGDQRRRDSLNKARRPQDDKQREDKQADDERLTAPEVRHLGKENQDPEGVDEPGHHRRGDKAHQARHAAQTKQNLNNTRQNDGWQNVTHAVLMHHRANDQRY